MTVPFAQQLVSAGFSRFAIGLVPNAANRELVLVHHPEGGDGFETRQAFLNLETGLYIRLYGEPSRGSNGHFQETESNIYNQGWGVAREFGTKPTTLMLGPYLSDSPLQTYLQQAFERAWETCRRFPAIRWDVNAGTLNLPTFDLSLLLFGNVLSHWEIQTQSPERIYFPIKSSDLFNAGLEALLVSFRRDNVIEYPPQEEKRPPVQLDLF